MTPDPQSQAADPAVSAFVTANAGSGKTTTLVARVARLLLAGAEPQAILCVTYTKAAAAEMQQRLFRQLGEWSVMEDAKLRKRLESLDGGGGPVQAEDLSRARALFARALETPGGLKIQTIHAFCEKLLRRFPLEAEVSPGFQVMDDSASARIAKAAREEVARAALHGAGPLAQAYARLSVALNFEAFQKMFTSFEVRRADLAAYALRCGGLPGVEADVWARCGFDTTTSVEKIEQAALAELDGGLWRSCADILRVGTASDGKTADKLLEAAASGEMSKLLSALFTDAGEGTPAKWVETNKALQSHPSIRSAFLAEQDRLQAARERARAARIAQDTVMALILAQAYVAFYEIEKTAVGRLDFADLILKTSDLLTTRADAAWVMYKLDGGVDHILLDEAQDTAPDQWTIVKAFTAEFFAGAGLPRLRANLQRTLFVVGDEKQSIYSFQGADPDLLREETEHYAQVIAEAGLEARVVKLAQSYRSTPQVLGFVDAVFADPLIWTGVPPSAGEDQVSHIAMRHDHPGCIDLWPLERETPGEDRQAWDDPLDQEGPGGANQRLAKAIAEEIHGLITRREAVFDKEQRRWRPAHAGDVLILVKRRRALFEEILRALKRRGLPVAGADRLSLSEHILFDDLAALARFIQFSDDDLTLAALLKSPLCGLEEDSLFALAHGREASLWRALQGRAGEQKDWRSAHALLMRAIDEARAHRPFDFFSRILGWTDADGRSVRARILERLGAEAQEVIDEFLAQVLNAERSGVADLERLAAAFAGLDIVVKREMDGARDEVRVMTVHGAKGLEAPIVIMPETTVTRSARGSPLLQTKDGGFLWAPTAKQDCDASKSARQWRDRREDEEGQRLFYVALTRARDRLVLCGRINSRTKDETVGGWYAAARAALDHPLVAPQVRTVQRTGMEVRRFGPDPHIAPPEDEVLMQDTPLPPWAARPASAETLQRFASPSRLGEEAGDAGSAPSPLQASGGLGRFRRGDLIHRLLQRLPDLADGEREDAAARLLSREPGLTGDQRAEIVAAALGVLTDDRFAAVFGPGSRAEAAIAGRAPGLGPTGAVAGRVDRLLIEKDRVLVVDFKTNRPSPDRIEDADPAYLRQMAVYGAVLQSIFPERQIEAALVWTDGPKLMAVPENLRAKVLAGLAQAVDS